MSSWIFPFFIGVIVGQHPRLKPYAEAAYRRIVSIGKELATEVEKDDGKKIDGNPELKKGSFWIPR